MLIHAVNQYSFSHTLFLIAVFTMTFFAPASARDGLAVGSTIILAVPGIPGPYCAYGIEKRLLQLKGVERVHIDWAAERLVIDTHDGESLPGAEEIDKAIQAADYPYRYTILEKSRESPK